MVEKNSIYRKTFLTMNYIFLALVAVLCLMPFLNVISISFSSSYAVASNSVLFWPIEFNLKSYKFVMSNPSFLRSIFVSIERVVLGVSLNMLLIVLVAYPLSKDKKAFGMRSIYSWFFLLTMLFSGGLIPWYMTIKYTGLIDTIWALVLPNALNVFSMIVLLNFFRGLPVELEESAFVDGASHWTILWKIFIPLSRASLATVLLFCFIGHWNSWFDGLILMNKPENYPLPSYLQTVIINVDTFFQQQRSTQEILKFVNERTSRSAQLLLGTLPVLIVYPYIQKYFTTGLVLGSIKG